MDRLSAREEKILELLLVGASNKRIARDLNISTATVKADMHEILRKLNATNRTGAVAIAQRRGILREEREWNLWPFPRRDPAAIARRNAAPLWLKNRPQ